MFRTAIGCGFVMMGMIGCTRSDPDAQEKVPVVARADLKPDAVADPPGAQQEEQQVEKHPEKGKPDGADGGKALPAGAVVRLGTHRWRHEANMIAYSPDGNYLARHRRFPVSV